MLIAIDHRSPVAQKVDGWQLVEVLGFGNGHEVETLRAHIVYLQKAGPVVERPVRAQ